MLNGLLDVDGKSCFDLVTNRDMHLTQQISVAEAESMYERRQI